VFFKEVAAGLIAGVIGVPVAWQMLKTGHMLPLIVGVGFVTVGCALPLFLIPETRARAIIPDPTLETDDEGGLLDVEPHHISTRKRISNFIENAKETSFVFKSPMLFAISLTFLLQTLPGRSGAFLVQLASTRFNWTLGEVSWLNSLPTTLLTHH
jgi:hypothetical protein